MKLYVAGLLVLATFSSGIIAHGQNPPRSSKSAGAKSRDNTMRICQGVPVPDGYVIVAYMTSSACPHGAYLLKKQSDYENSLTFRGDARQSEDSSEPSNGPVRRSRGRNPGSARTSADNAVTGAALPGSSQRDTVNGTPSATRPRRVSTQEIARNDTNVEPAGPPALIGSAPAKPAGPPRLSAPGAIASENTTESGANVPAAEPSPEEVDEGDVVRVDTTLVTVPVSVLDRQGRFVPGLKREDFTIVENGVEQSIAYFEPAEKPFTVALLLDTSASTHFHLSEIRQAAIAFAKQLRPQDRVLVVSFNDEVLLLTEATNDLTLIEDVIEVNANTGSSTRLYDAVDLTIRERLNTIAGRKAIVLFTDGVDTSSQQATYQSTLREVDELDALIYPIQYDTTDYLRAMQGTGSVTVTTTRRGIFGTTTSQQTYNVPLNGGAPLPGSTKADYDRADQYLHALADKTGGRLYQANDTTQLAEAFTRIAEELRRQYSLGYYPKAQTVTNDQRRQIRVRVRQPNLAVKARDSYLKSSPNPK